MSRVTAMFMVILLCCTACAPITATAVHSTHRDKLAEIMARSTLVIATDADYAPQSKLLPNSTPDPDSKCSPAQYTASQMTGFDVDVAREVALQLGVEPCFVTPPWSQLVAGNWGDNWDIHVGSVAITFERMKVLYFTQPYYATPSVVLVHADNNTLKMPEDLSGKRIGVCVGCTFEAYLKGTLQIPGEQIEYRIKNARIVGYENEEPAIADLAAGDGVILDAVITILPLARQAINSGKPVKILGEPLLFAYASITLDRSGKRDSLRLLENISNILRELHANGTLQQWSIKYQGQDLTQEAARFDLSVLHQTP
ncbi:MAG TPA: transporter substrate-binding domain-containing protein [Anaerolineales bacterium]|nr:transporter substrate-binding domain-containing protein [Anaerolineales bacterium]